MNIVDKHRQGFSSTVSAYDELSDTAKTLVHTVLNRGKHLCQLYVLKVDRTRHTKRCCHRRCKDFWILSVFRRLTNNNSTGRACNRSIDHRLALLFPGDRLPSGRQNCIVIARFIGELV